MFTKFASLTIAAAVTAIALGAAPAHAGNTCKKVYYNVVNKTGAKIKIVDLDYYNPARNKWGSEPTRNREIPNGRGWSDVRNLEGINARKTRLRIEYRKRIGGKWSKVRKGYSPSAVCRHGSQFQIVLR